MTRDLVIFDLDGTLADIRHRLHLVRQKPKRWREFFEACVNDVPNEPVIAAYRAFRQSALPCELWIFSGRSDAVRPQTERWLAQHVAEGAEERPLPAHLAEEVRPVRDGPGEGLEVLHEALAEPALLVPELDGDARLRGIKTILNC